MIGRNMGVDPNVLAAASGYLVTDVRGRIVGRVERASAGGQGRLVVKRRLALRRRRVVTASDIAEIDPGSGVVALSVARTELRSL
jgi:hypothetical protein